MSLKTLVFTILIATAYQQNLLAQEAQDSKITTNLGMGLNVPLNPTARFVGSSVNVVVGAGYNITQSEIAIGSGGFFGKGFLHGSQSQLNFLPEKHTDFIFTMIAEEFGFIGCIFVLLLYMILIGYGIAISLRCRHMFGSLLAIGVGAMLFIHIVINMMMVMGLIPVVGVPLPLLSYGGSIMISMLLGFGLMQNAYVYRDAHLPRAAGLV